MNINVKDTRNSHRKKYINVLSTLHLTQIVKDATRVTDCSSSLIDHILVNWPDMFYQVGTVE